MNAIALLLITLALAGCTTQREGPWIIERPLQYAPSDPAAPKPPPAKRQEKKQEKKAEMHA